MKKRKIKALFRNIIGKLVDSVVLNEEKQARKAISRSKNIITF